MADVLGAAASCGMVGLIAFLMGNFLVEIGKVKRETLKGLMKVFGIACVFAAAEYGAVCLIHVLRFGGENARNFQDLLRHPMFSGMAANSLPAHYAMAAAVLLTALAGGLLFLSLHRQTGERAALGTVSFVYMLPGMELAFFPAGLAGVLVMIGLSVWMLRKKIKGKVRPFRYMEGLMALFGVMKMFILYMLAAGV